MNKLIRPIHSFNKTTLLLKSITFSLFILLGSSSFAQEQKVVGYIDASLANSVDNAGQLQWDHLTDLIYGFIQPTSSGTFPDMSGNTTFQDIKTLADNNNVKLHFSAGGAAFGGTVFSQIGSNPSTASTFASNVADLLQSTGMIGFDLDWEFPRQPSEIAAHLNIIQALDAEFTARGKRDEWEIAIAVGGETQSLGTQSVYHTDYIDTDVFQYLDYLNLMSYDVGISLAGDNHSSLAAAVANINDWNAIGCPKSKMVIGVPFYSRGATSRFSWQRYSQLAATNPSVAYNSDNIGTNHYNGRPLLEQKVDLSQAEGTAGLMIWEITYDLLGPNEQYSLLRAIGERMSEYGCSAPDLPAETSLCATGSATLETLLPTQNRTFTWTFNGGTYNGGDQGNASITVSAEGLYEVTVDSGSGSCVRVAEINVSQSLPAIDLGPDFDLCQPSVVTLDAGISGTGYTYEWSIDGAEEGTGQTFDASQAGVHSVLVTAGTCNATDQVTVTSSLPEVDNQTICSGTTATFMVNNPTGDYQWCSDPACANSLGSGNSYTTTTLNSSTDFYVKDISAFETPATGPSLASLGLEKTYAASATLYFDASSDFTIKTIQAGAYLWGASASAGISIDKDGTNYGTATVDFPATTGSVQAEMDVDIAIPAGTGYEITFTGAKINWFGNGMTLPATYESLITFTAFSQEGLSASFPSLTDWVLSAGTNCDPAKVTATVGICTGLGDDVKNNAFAVYPNPSSSTITIDADVNSQWQLYSTLGDLVLTGNDAEVDLSTLDIGLYVLKLDGKSVRIEKQ